MSSEDTKILEFNQNHKSDKALFVIHAGLECLIGKFEEKYITFTVPLEKEVTIIDKSREEITKNIPYILQFIDSERFIKSSLSNLISS